MSRRRTRSARKPGCPSRHLTVYQLVGFLALLVVLGPGTVEYAAAQTAPRVVVTALEFTPAPPATDYCSGFDFNTIRPGGVVEALAVGETDVLRLTARAVDDDGDPVRIFVGPETRALPGFVEPPEFSPDSTVVTVTVAMPYGQVRDVPCEQQGLVVLSAREQSAFPDSQRVEMPTFAVWTGPDIEVSVRYVGATPVEVSVRYVGAAPVLQGLLRWNGRVRSVGPDPVPDFADSLYVVEIWIVDPDGLRVTERPPFELTGRQVSVGFNIPEIQTFATRTGTYCGRVQVISGRELNLANSDATDCVTIAVGAVRVVPNVATPNGDGHNDTVDFLVANTGATNPRVTIYDLAGREVFTTDVLGPGQRLSWNGRDGDGNPVPSGSYLYVVSDGSRTLASGNCGVVR